MGDGALSYGDMGAPAEWLREGAGYAGEMKDGKGNDGFVRQLQKDGWSGKGCGDDRNAGYQG